MGYRSIEERKAKNRAYYLANRETIIGRVQSHYRRVRSEKLEYAKAHRKKNQEKYLAYDRERQRTQNQIRNAARLKHYHDNPGKFRVYCHQQYLKHRKKKTASNLKWRNKNRGRRAAGKHLRRAKKMGAPIGDPKAISNYFQQVHDAKVIVCHWCGKKVPRGRRHIDHIHPLSRGGAHSLENLTAACQTCNLRKHDMLPDEFIRYLAMCPE